MLRPFCMLLSGAPQDGNREVLTTHIDSTRVRTIAQMVHHLKNLQHFVAGFLLYTKDFLSDW
jgi:hypothetical protein